jgi:hypothetical protein
MVVSASFSPGSATRSSAPLVQQRAFADQFADDVAEQAIHRRAAWEAGPLGSGPQVGGQVVALVVLR